MNPGAGHKTDIFEQALKLEVEGYNFYSQCAENTENPLNEKLFRQLADDEKTHYNRFTRLYQEHDLTSYERFQMGYKGGYFNSRVFGDVPDEKLLDSLSDREVIEYAINAEKRSISLYKELMMNELNPEAALAIKKIMGEEEKHLASLREVLDG